MRINASRFFPHRYRTNIFTSFNVGPVLLNSELHTHIPKVNRMHNGFAVWDNSVKSLVQVHPALLEACDQFLVVAAAGTLCVSSGRPSLDRQSHNPEEACREIHLWFSLSFRCLNVDGQKLSSQAQVWFYLSHKWPYWAQWYGCNKLLILMCLQDWAQNILLLHKSMLSTRWPQ